MESMARPRQRLRFILTCNECRKRKQKCDRKVPCTPCLVRGTQDICSYETRKPALYDPWTQIKENILMKPSLSNPPPLPSSRVGSAVLAESRAAPAMPRHTLNHGCSDADPLSSMKMLTKVLPETGHIDIPSPHTDGEDRSEYYSYIRRLPSRNHCDKLFHFFFTHLNPLCSPLDQTIFREQLQRWWDLAHNVLTKEGPNGLPEEIRCFPALIFQVVAITLQFISGQHEAEIGELRFGPSQTVAELSKEYSDCGVSLSSVVGSAKLTLIGVQHSSMRDWWLLNTGDLVHAWTHSGETVRDAMAIGLHREPETPSTSHAEELLDCLWNNEMRKRTWLNIFVFDVSMTLIQGQPMLTNLKECTVSPPVDCDIPIDRLTRVPVGRTDFEKPSPMTERILRLKMTRRLCEIRDLEVQGSIPRDPEKVKELHDFAIEFRKLLPSFYRTPDPDTSWDVECPFVPNHREQLCFLVDAFLIALHRPYVFTREQSQRQVYDSTLVILDSQERLFQAMNMSESPIYIGCTVPTFEASVLLAVVLISNPGRYHESFWRPYDSLKRAIHRLECIGPHLSLARSGAVILQTALSRIIQARQGAGLLPTNVENLPGQHGAPGTESSSSAGQSLDSEAWHFAADQSTLDWMAQGDGSLEFDFSNLEVPMPLKELLMDEEMAKSTQVENLQGLVRTEELFTGYLDNELWNFLAGYCPMNADEQS